VSVLIISTLFTNLIFKLVLTFMAKLVFDFVSELNVPRQVFVGDEDPTNRARLLRH